LPDGLFSYQKSQSGYILGGFGVDNFNICYDHLVFTVNIWYVYGTFVYLCRLGFFAYFGMFYKDKSGNPSLQLRRKQKKDFKQKKRFQIVIKILPNDTIAFQLKSFHVAA
jgi:hypothetical protein